jgi:hypothetical protein
MNKTMCIREFEKELLRIIFKPEKGEVTERRS